MKTALILNGPNLNLLGHREPEKYGYDTLDDLAQHLDGVAQELGMALEHKQSNWEGQLIDWIHEARGNRDAIIINPGAFTHYSYAIFDALNSYEGLVFEVHITNVYAREAFRHHSVISPRADGVMAGMGLQGYEFALRRARRLLGE